MGANRIGIEIWMWGRDEARGTSLYWLIHHKVLRRGQWVDAIPYSCGTEVHAHGQADVMSNQKSHGGDLLYSEVNVTGPCVEWIDISWRYRDEWRKPSVLIRLSPND